MKRKRNTKRALLTSMLSFILCFAMLLGTTFAWFTDSASTGVNKIQAGNLDLAVYHEVGFEMEKIDGLTNLFDNIDDEAILWEPGAQAVETFLIKNEGNLALKYQFNMNYTNATKVEGTEKTLCDVLKVQVAPMYILDENEDLVLDDRENNMVGYPNPDPARDQWIKMENSQFEEYLLPGESRVLYVCIAWEPTANDNDYNVKNGLKIDLGVNVLATQYTYEKDSRDEQYDKNAEYTIEVSTIDELRNAIASNSNAKIILTNDIELSSEDDLIIAAGSGANVAKAILNVRTDAVIDLNGKKLTYSGSGATFGIYVGSGAALTILDSSSDNSGCLETSNSGAWVVQVGKGTANIYGGNFSTANDCCIYANNGKINIYGGKFECSENNQLTLNIGNVYRGEGRGIYVYGGTFKNFEPGVTNNEEVFLGDGYQVTSESSGSDIWYTVSK